MFLYVGNYQSALFHHTRINQMQEMGSQEAREWFVLHQPLV